MPSPIGHALAGWAIARTFEAVAPAATRGTTPGTVACALAADLDMLPGLWNARPDAEHKKDTHSLGAALGAGLVVGVWSRQQGRPFGANALRGAVAYASHLLLDGFSEGSEGGMRLFWPVSKRLRRVPGVWFRAIRSKSAERGFVMGLANRHNLRAAAREVATLAPAVLVAPRLGRWLRRS